MNLELTRTLTARMSNKDNRKYIQNQRDSIIISESGFRLDQRKLKMNKTLLQLIARFEKT